MILRILKNKLTADQVSHPILLLILLVCYGLLLQWNSLNLPLIRDEGEYAYAAWLMIHGDGMPYIESFMQKPPMVIYTYILANSLSGQECWPPRLLALLFLASAGWLLKITVQKQFFPRSGRLVPWLLLPMVLLPNIDQFTANIEKFAVLPIVVMLWLFATYKEKTEPLYPLAAGAIGAVIFLFKYSLAPIVLFIYIAWQIYLYRSLQLPSIRPVVMCGRFMFLGFIGTMFVFLLPFLEQKRLVALYECTILFNHAYATVHSLQWHATEHWLEFFIKSWPLTLPLTVLFFIRPIQHRWFYLGLLAATLISTSGSWYGQYYIPFMVVWSIILSVAASELECFFHKPAIRRITGWTVSLVLVAGMIWPSRNLFVLSQIKMETIKFSSQPFSESLLAAKKLIEWTAPTDRVLVAGSEPQILYYARRKSATRFTIFYPLTLSTGLAEDYQAQAIAELKARPPKAIVLIQSPYSWLLNKRSPKSLLVYLETVLQGPSYRLAGFFTRQQNGIEWQPSQPGAELRKASILLFIEKDSIDESSSS